ncbi:threonylcarbamoyl-AMP synthase [Candidatus Bathyarchaeota archaeon]|nr:threonylcarbamoyl-AMP synthase [Candidatus Bathyarchaeota archaeon]
MTRTVILEVNREKPEKPKIKSAADVIRNGGLVAFPTETVYGLGADALNAKAVKRIYAAKKRPLDNPIIVHVATEQETLQLTKNIPLKAKKLISVFWPGPLTLVLRACEKVPKAITGGLDTVAVRMPRHNVALALIEESGVPIAAPSANRSGRPSPTTAEHVRQDLDGRIEMILDGGSTNIGVESTVLDVTVDPPEILRPGGTTYEELVKIVGQVKIHPAALAEKSVRAKVPSPGMKHRHYAPTAELVLVEGSVESTVEKTQQIINYNLRIGKRVGVLATDETKDMYEADVVKSLGSRADLSSAARSLFRLLREFDEDKVDIIVAEGVPLEGLGLAVMNRLRKASNYRIVKAD